MKRFGWLVLFVVVCMIVWTSGCSQFNAEKQVGEVNATHSIIVEHGLFTGTKVKIDTAGKMTADELDYSKANGMKATKLVVDSNPVPVIQARTAQEDKLLPLSQEWSHLNQVYGQNAAIIFAGMEGLATAVLDGLPAGQLRQAVVGVVQAIEAAKAHATQPAASQPGK